MYDYECHEHDVVVIGAGGAGLRAAIEASSMGVSVALVCKSMLGKAHTVMAEGGAAAALGAAAPRVLARHAPQLRVRRRDRPRHLPADRPVLAAEARLPRHENGPPLRAPP